MDIPSDKRSLLMALALLMSLLMSLLSDRLINAAVSQNGRVRAMKG